MSLLSELIDVSIRTMVGLLPTIINTNNKSISDYIENNIYDSTNLYIKSNIYNIGNNGYVKSYTGEFKNLTVDHLILNDTTTMNSVMNNVEHNTLISRYLYDNSGTVEVMSPDLISSDLAKYAHNSGAIGVELGDGTVKSLRTVLEDIISSVSDLQTKFLGNVADGNYINVYGTNLSSNNEQSNTQDSLSDPNSFTFDNSLLFASKVLLKRMNLPSYLYDDITSGYLYTYYSIANVVTITDDHTASIEGIPGSTIKIKFKDNLKKAFYRIVLSRPDKKYLRISKDELNRLTLTCVRTSEIDGTIWEVNDYSVRSAEDIMIEKK